jgi:predicted NAD/FAD-binding protein
LSSIHSYSLSLSSSHRPNRPILRCLRRQIVFNPPTYPNFLRFLDLRKRTVEVIETEMTFSVSRDGGAFEWAGDGLRSVFCQPGRVLDLGMWRMLFDIGRFNACAVRVLGEDDDLSIGEYLQREGYSPQFRDNYLIVCAHSYARFLWVVYSLVVL